MARKLERPIYKAKKLVTITLISAVSDEELRDNPRLKRIKTSGDGVHATFVTATNLFPERFDALRALPGAFFCSQYSPETKNLTDEEKDEVDAKMKELCKNQKGRNFILFDPLEVEINVKQGDLDDMLAKAREEGRAEAARK